MHTDMYKYINLKGNTEEFKEKLLIYLPSALSCENIFKNQD